MGPPGPLAVKFLVVVCSLHRADPEIAGASINCHTFPSEHMMETDLIRQASWHQLLISITSSSASPARNDFGIAALPSPARSKFLSPRDRKLSLPKYYPLPGSHMFFKIRCSSDGGVFYGAWRHLSEIEPEDTNPTLDENSFSITASASKCPPLRKTSVYLASIKKKLIQTVRSLEHMPNDAANSLHRGIQGSGATSSTANPLPSGLTSVRIMEYQIAYMKERLNDINEQIVAFAWYQIDYEEEVGNPRGTTGKLEAGSRRSPRSRRTNGGLRSW
ncbi:hypothetical protein B0H66DRAFT_591778 [Apodospora peruviana]|uniref:Uncharacterized protein n=1 Tax=Apodospora peruviana TaxID=516989 RepID=A0AAE0I672_9PEZI|nr:hypothetical protein B0H66DRAFT_591778 [Apodospora peruviana]